VVCCAARTSLAITPLWHDDGLWVAVRDSTSGIYGGCSSLVRAGSRRPLRVGDDATDVPVSRVLAVRSVMRFALVVFTVGHVIGTP